MRLRRWAILAANRAVFARLECAAPGAATGWGLSRTGIWYWTQIDHGLRTTGRSRQSRRPQLRFYKRRQGNNDGLRLTELIRFKVAEMVTLGSAVPEALNPAVQVPIANARRQPGAGPPCCWFRAGHECPWGGMVPGSAVDAAAAKPMQTHLNPNRLEPFLAGP